MSDVISRVRLSEEADAYVKEMKEKRNESSQAKIIDQLLLEHQQEHKDLEKGDYVTSMLMAQMNQKIEQEFHKYFNRLQLGVNNTDRNSQMLLELMNGLMVSSNISDIMPTSEFTSKPYTTAKEEVNERIANLQQRKAEYEKKQNQPQGG
ncbi:hypothetical protein CHL76_12050 [Marinococcus halophilus]|uniref:Uncharacterized protein n=1 Tax=Marinococcus halophilus TaxID=1371 RepID=A0A510Y7T3_MARHA|nr:hypothetical protein [Marinococcus halophilus]OZT79638.1 hypothetical protein CHL76_12050 [Marinococcus halophilus]GEK59422.1 hypothetical protein MHA01_23270 [Marinococcus halophilus]